MMPEEPKKKNINCKELKHYEKHVPMTTKEKKALQSWVAHGNSVHRNFYGAVDEETGIELDFLPVYRDTQKDTSIPWEAAGANMKTIKSLKSDIRRFQQELIALWMFISKEELVYEANEFLEETDCGKNHFPFYIQ